MNEPAWRRLVTRREVGGPALYRFQITGGPEWLDSARFDIIATSAPGKASSMPEDAAGIVKALLAERFKLVVRDETKEGPIDALSLVSRDGQLGPKLRRADFTCPLSGTAPPPSADPAQLKKCEYRIGYAAP
jgi:uncharacterized protein (TIGR03435 family)